MAKEGPGELINCHGDKIPVSAIFVITRCMHKALQVIRGPKCANIVQSVQTVEHVFLQVILGSVQLIVWNPFCNACKYTGFNVSDKMRKYCARQ